MRTFDYTSANKINQFLKNNNIASGVFPEASIEWNFNNCFPARGANLVNAGDDIYSFGNDERLYSVDRFGRVGYPKTEAGKNLRKKLLKAGEHVAKAWVEPFDQTIPIITSNPNHNKLYNYSSTKIMPPAENGYGAWYSQMSQPATNFFASKASELQKTFSPVYVTAQQGPVDIIGFITQTPSSSGGTVRLLVGSRQPQSAAGKIISTNGSIRGSQWDSDDTLFLPPGRYTISSVGEGYLPDVVWGTTRGGQNVIKFNQYRNNTFRVGDRIKPQTSGQPGNWWNSDDGFAKVTGVSKNFNNAPAGRYWVDINFSPEVGDGVLFRGQEGVIYTYFYWIDISVDKVPNIVANSTLGIKQITGVTPVTGQIVEPVTNEQQLRDRLAASAKDGSAVYIDDDITLNNPIVLPSNLDLFAGSHTISASANFNEVYEYLVYSSVPEMYFGSCSSSGNTNTISVASTSGLYIGQAVKIQHERPVSSPAGWGGPVAEKVVFSANITSITSTTISLDQTIGEQFSNVPLYVYANSNSRVSGRINIYGGTWNTSAASHDVGVVKISNTETCRISGATFITGSDADCVSIEGSNSVSVFDCSFSSDAAALSISSGAYGSQFKNSQRIHVDGCTFNSAVGISSVQQLGASVPNHSIIKISNNVFTSSSSGLSLQNCTDLYVGSNSFSGAGNGISLLSINAKSHSVIINANSFNNSGEEMRLGGLNSESGYTGVLIKNNTGVDQSPILINAAFVAWINNKNSSDQITSNPAGTFSANDYPVMAAAPTTIYNLDAVEVMRYKKTGSRIELFLASNISSVKPGKYVVVENVHPQIDGARKVLGYSYQDNQVKVTLSSNLYGDINEQTVDNNDNVGFLISTRFLPVNSVTAKFDSSFGLPSSGIIQLLTDDGWQSVYSFSSSDLTDEQEEDVSRATNIKSLRVFFDGSWSTTKNADMNVKNSVNAGAVRVVIVSTSEDQSVVCVPHVSARLFHEISDDIASFSIDKELGDANTYTPVGVSSSNTGSISLSNDNLLYSATNSSSPLYELFVQDAAVHMYLSYPDSKIKLATMIVSGWDSSLREEAEIKLIDKSIILQNASVLDSFIYQKDSVNENLSGISITDAIKSMLLPLGFGNILFFGSPESLKAFYTRDPETPWEVLQELLEPYQAAAYFDEYGVLQIMYRDYIFPETYFVDANIFQDGSEYKAEIPVGSDVPLQNGMSVTDSVDYNNTATISSFNKNVVTLSNQMPLGRYTLRLSSSRGGNNYVVGRNSELETEIDISEIHSVGPSHYYNFNIEKITDVDGISNYPRNTQTANKFTKSNEFYVSSASRTGGSVTVDLNWSSAMVKTPAVGDSMFFSLKNLSLDAQSTDITSVSVPPSTTDYATVSYAVSGSLNIPVSNRISGEAGYRSGKIYYKLTNIFPGKTYEFKGFVAKSSSLDLSISSDCEISETFVLNDEDVWTPFSISFVADSNSPEIAIDIDNINFGDSVYMCNESVVCIDGPGGAWKDEIISISQQVLESASSIDVVFSTINPYSEKSTSLEGNRQVGQNSELWKLDDYILPVFELIELDVVNSKFRFNQSGMNEGAITQPTSSNDKIYAWIPYSGKFSTESNPSYVYEYEGLEAEIYAPYENTGQPSELYVVKSESDYVDARNKNLGLPLRWTGVGFLKKTYPDLEPGTGSLFVSELVNVDAVYDNSEFKNVSTPLATKFNKLYVSSGNSRRAIYFDEKISNINTVGLSLSSKFASQNSEVGLIFNGDKETSSGMFVGIKIIDGNINASLRLKNEYGEVEKVNSEMFINLEENQVFASQLDPDIIAKNSLYLPSIYKIHSQIQENGELSTVSLFFNNNLLASFEVETSLLIHVGGTSPGIYMKNCSGFVSAVYWASQSEPFVDGSILENGVSSADLYAQFTKDNPFSSRNEVLSMISEYNDVVVRGASNFGELIEYRKRGIPHENFGFYGFQRNSDVIISGGTLR